MRELFFITIGILLGIPVGFYLESQWVRYMLNKMESRDLYINPAITERVVRDLANYLNMSLNRRAPHDPSAAGGDQQGVEYGD